MFRKMVEIFVPCFLGSLASVVGIGAGLNSLIGGGPSQIGGGTANTGIYVPQGLSQADTYIQQLLGAQTGQTNQLSSTIDPILMSVLANNLGINTQPLVQAGQQAGQQYGNLSGLNQLYGNILQQLGIGSAAAGQQVYQQGADPQQQLYNTTVQQLQDQTRQGQAVRGLGNSPEGSMEEADVMSNFNINWQNSQLARTLAGLSGMLQANQGAGTDLSGATALFGAQPQNTLAAAQTPIAASTSAYSQPQAAATQYGTGIESLLMQPNANVLAQLMNYLSGGTTAGSAAAGAFNTNQLLQGQNTAAGTNSLLTGLSGLFGSQSNPSSFSTGAGNWLSTLFGGGGGGTDTSGLNYTQNFGTVTPSAGGTTTYYGTS